MDARPSKLPISSKDGRCVRRALENQTPLRLAAQLPAARHPLGTSRRELRRDAPPRLRPNPPQAFMRCVLVIMMGRVCLQNQRQRRWLQGETVSRWLP